MEILREAPKPSSFVPLIEHQSTTPASFYSGLPVLHYYSDRSKLIVLEHEIESAPEFAPILAAASTHHQENGTQANGEQSDQNKQKVVDDVDVWVTSE
jgi:nucleotide-sensitive chloride channel 1A